MANYITAPFFAAIGIAAGIFTKTNEVIAAVRGGDVSGEGQAQPGDTEAERFASGEGES
jgi:hypothetical protein